MIDYYKVLRVSPGVSQEALKEQYRFLVQAFHPDKFSGAGREKHRAWAENETKKLNQAYEVLKDSTTRREYDRQREAERARVGGTHSSPPPQRPSPPPRPAPTPPTRKPRAANPRVAAPILVALIAIGLLSVRECTSDHGNADTQSKKSAAGGEVGSIYPKLVSMTPAEAYEFGYTRLQPQFDKAMASIKDQLYPESDLNRIRRSHGQIELTPANADAWMRGVFGRIGSDPETRADVLKEAASAGVSGEVTEAYLRGVTAAGEEIMRGDTIATPANGTSQAVAPAAAPRNESQPDSATVAGMDTPMGRYNQLVKDAVGMRWNFNVQQRSDLIGVGSVKIHFAITQSGKVEDIRIVSGKPNTELANISLDAISEAEIPPIPPDVAATLDGKPLEVDYDFTNNDKDNKTQNDSSPSAQATPDRNGFDNGTATVPAVPNDALNNRIALLGVSLTPGGGDYTLYTDSEHGYSVMVPAILASNLRQEPSGEGISATSPDGGTKFLVRVKHGVGTLKALYKQWTAEHTAKDPGKVVDYKTLRSDWFVVSGFDGQRVYYVKVVARGSEALFMYLEYDRVGGNLTQDMLTTMSRSFTGHKAGTDTTR